jgi:hypothetical protein
VIGSALDPFSDILVIGALDPGTAAKHLREIGDDDLAALLEVAGHPAESPDHRGLKDLLKWPFQNRPWQYTKHAFGYIAPNQDTKTLKIVNAGRIKPDASLKGGAIKLTLDRLRVANYPGTGLHNVLFDFYARNQSADHDQEDLHFNVLLRALEGQEAGVVGFPIFVGLNVGPTGVSLRCATVNVKNDSDETFLSFLESDTFRSGLQLAKVAQPALAQFSEMVLSITRAIAKRNRNVLVQNFYMGLDFGKTATGARLAEG